VRLYQVARRNVHRFRFATVPSADSFGFCMMNR
jgi:hypothetical protein